MKIKYEKITWRENYQCTTIFSRSNEQVGEEKYIEEMETFQNDQPQILQSLTNALKKSKLYNNEQVGKTTKIKKSKFYHVHYLLQSYSTKLKKSKLYNQ